MLLRGGNGTGKTLAYLLPILNNLYKQQSEEVGKFGGTEAGM